jgi:hypothetical protein
VLAAGVAYCLVAVYFGIHFYTVAPFADTWNIIDEIAKNHGRVSLAMLWAQHNEHRMAMTKLLMWADLFWARGKGSSLFFEIYLIQTFVAFLMMYAVLRVGKWRWVDAQAALGVALFCRFYLLQYDMFLWSFCIQVAPTYALGALAYVALARYAITQNRGWLAAAAMAAFLAPLNLAGGQVVWPVLCVAAWNLRLKIRTVLLFAGSGAVSIAVYLIGYSSTPGQSPWVALRQPGALLRYNLLYFAGSWDSLSRPVGYVLAVAALSGVIAWSIKIVIRRDASPLRVALLALASSLMANAFLTSLGRWSFGLEQATESRYQTAALLFWCCIFLLSMDLLLEFAPKFAPALTGTALALMLVAALNTPAPWQKGNEFYERMDAGILPLVADVEDDAVVSKSLYGTPWRIFEDTGFMRIHGMSFFDTPEYRRMDSRLADIYQVSGPERCAGNFDGFEALPDTRWPGYRAFGWGWDRSLKRALDKIVIANQAGRIIGLARGGSVRPDVKSLMPGVTSSFSGWRGYASGSFAWQRAQAYGELPGGREVCLLPGNPVRP